MSLQVWLPLTGNLNNNGVSGTTVTNYNITFDTNGKLGSCALNSTAGNKLTIPNPITTSTDEFSISCWFYLTQFTNGYACLCCDRTQTSGKGIAIWIQASSIRIDTDEMWAFSKTTDLNTWYHFCLTWSKTKGKYVYINGIQVAYKASVGLIDNITSTLWIAESMQNDVGNYSLVGKLNDFRIYDHALSVKEVKELAKGLVIHYPLTGNVGTYNLALGSNTNSINTNKFKYSQQNGGSTCTIEYDGGIPCLKITRNSTEFSGWAYFSYQNLLSTEIKESTTYTVSFDIISSGSGNISFNGFLNGNATNYLTNSTSVIQGSFNSTSWSHIVLRATTKDSFEGITIGAQQVYMGCPYMNATEVWIMMKNMKVEEGTVDTPWNPNPADALYNTLGFNDLVEYDISGYNYNGIKTGEVSYDNDSVRYPTCIHLPNLSYITYELPLNMYYATFSFWVKAAAFTAYGGIHMPPNNPTGGDAPWFAFNTEGNDLWCYIGKNTPSYTRGVSGSLSTNIWYHCTYTWNNGVAQWYLNGEKHGNSTTYTGKTYIVGGSVTIGNSYTGSSWNGTPFTGQISDFRVYTTCLSDDDIKELYNTPINISDNGDLSTQGEFLEGGELVRFGKNGMINASGAVKPNLVSGTNRGEVSSTAKSVSDRMLCYNSGGDGVCSVSEDITVPVGKYSYNIVGNTTGNRDFQQRAIPYKAGKSYTGSWWAKGSGKILYRVWDVTAGKGLLSKTFNLTADWAFYSHTFEATQEMEDDNCTFHLGVTGVAEIHLCGMKLEENDHPTPWTYNKYDAGFDIDNNFVEENNPTIGNQNYITAKELKEI